MDLGIGGRGGARRRTRRRANARAAMRENAYEQQQGQVSEAEGNSPVAMLDMLKVLHSEGILTDDEFNAKKSILVDRM